MAEEETEEETDFAEDLVSQGQHDITRFEDEVEEDAEVEAEKKADPFDDPQPRKKSQRNWLEHGLTENVSMDKKQRGRPKGSPNKGLTKQDAIKEAIQMLTAAGVNKTAMAKILGISIPRLNRNFGHELEHGADMLKTRIVSAIVKKALDGNMTAALFYMKAKGGWREADKNDLPDTEALALSDVERNQRLMALLMNNPKFKVIMEQKRMEISPIDSKQIKEEDVFDV